MNKTFSYLFFLSILIVVCTQNSFSQNFSLEQIPKNENLNAENSAGIGLSLALHNNKPFLSAYSKVGKLLFIEEINNEWVFQSLTDDIVEGILHKDKYETSLIFVNDEPVIFYYDGSVGQLKYAYRNNNAWNHAVIDSDSGADIGGFVEAISLSPGEVQLCYQDNTNSNLKVAKGSLGNELSIALIDTDGGSWCSFLNENSIVYSANGVIKKADYSNNTWSVSNVGINGYQPTGAINSNGSVEIYSSETKASWGNNGVSDFGMNYFYQASQGFPNTGSTDAGAYPSYLRDVGYAFRFLRYSALFGASSYVRAFLLEADGNYSYTIGINDGCLGEIRHLKLAQAGNGDRYIGFYYHCRDTDQQVIKLAFKAAPEEDNDEEEDTGDDSGSDNEEEEEEEDSDDNEVPDNEEENDDEEDNQDNDENDDEEDENSDDENTGSEEDEASINVEKIIKKRFVQFNINIRSALNETCRLYAETSNRRFRKLYSTKFISNISGSSELIVTVKPKYRSKASAFLRFRLNCHNQDLVSSSTKLKAKNKNTFRNNKKKDNKRFGKLISKRVKLVE